MQVSRSQSVSSVEEEIKRYRADKDVIQGIDHIRGGPSSYVRAGASKAFPNIQKQVNISSKPSSPERVDENTKDVNKFDNDLDDDDDELQVNIDTKTSLKVRKEEFYQKQSNLIRRETDVKSSLKQVLYDALMNEAFARHATLSLSTTKVRPMNSLSLPHKSLKFMDENAMESDKLPSLSMSPRVLLKGYITSIKPLDKTSNPPLTTSTTVKVSPTIIPQAIIGGELEEASSTTLSTLKSSSTSIAHQSQSMTLSGPMSRSVSIVGQRASVLSRSPSVKRNMLESIFSTNFVPSPMNLLRKPKLTFRDVVEENYES